MTKSPPVDTSNFRVVGIGASAGGLAAFKAFFSGMPTSADPNMAFVLVQHLAPDHKSILVELIQSCTRMKVFEITDGMTVEPNCIYIIPPGRDLAFINGSLQLLEPANPSGHRLPIDFFFRSLAQDQHERSIGIVLSGTGSDGMLGVRAIKGEGGIVIAQDPNSAEYASMPQSAIATGLVDFELPPAEMPARLIAYVAHAACKSIPAELAPSQKAQNAMTKIFLLIRAQTGHDFSRYKPNTIHRRIERRMAVHQISGLDAYVKYLQQTPSEVEELFRDMLIGVTNFFRDQAAFSALEHTVIPALFDGKPNGYTVRVWIAGCSTGEEAYSIAILLLEHAQKLKQFYNIQIFATDIDSRAVAAARAGIFPASIAADVSAERLALYFIPSTDGTTYRIRQHVRDTVVFSKHDLIKDQPFSKLDLISCRNLMIYLGADLQKKLIPLFHYALKPGGMLFLGTSEGIGEFDNLFSPLDRSTKLYSRKSDDGDLKTHGAYSHYIHSVLKAGTELSHQTSAVLDRSSFRQIAERALLQHVFMAGVLVNQQGDVLYIHGRTGLFLEPPPGEPGVTNILKMAREGLHSVLMTTLRKAIDTSDVIRHPNLNVKTNGHFSLVNLVVRPILSESKDSPSLYLVILEEANLPTPSTMPSTMPSTHLDLAPDNIIANLKDALRAKTEFLQSTQEELMSSNEELKSSNEEMQSMNEELHSTNEELETSKEELQSINEELTTINSELQTKVVDLTRANNDMNNLISGTGIGTVFVDHQIKILRFTPSVCTIINLIQADVGRPINHIASNLVNYTALGEDIKLVLSTLVPIEREVASEDGRWYLMRIRPYRTMENVIEGAVISFVDILEIVRARDDVRKAGELSRLAVIVRDSFDAVTVHDLSGRTIAWNPAATRLYGWSESEALKTNIRDRIPKALQAEELAMLAGFAQAETLAPYKTQRLTKIGEVVQISMVASTLQDEAGQVYAVATTERKINGETK